MLESRKYDVAVIRSPPVVKPDHRTAPKADGRHARGSLRRAALIDAARALFIQQGYRGTTLDAIIARAGGSRETIYRSFGGKKGLFGAIIAEVGEQLAQSIVTPDSLELPPRDALTRFGRALIAIWESEEGRAINRVVVSEGLDAPDLVDAWYSGGNKLSIVALSQYLRAQHGAGRLGEINPILVARQFVTLLAGEMTFPVFARDDDVIDTEERVRRCVDLILRAYGTGPVR